MLDRLSGKILHIDFGDCFEASGGLSSIHSLLNPDFVTDHHSKPAQVAMTREKFPEKIPFRLTRMLTNAMEVSDWAAHCNRHLLSLVQNQVLHKESTHSPRLSPV